MKRRVLVVLLLVAALAIAWALPSDVARLVAKGRAVLLGRYGEARFVGLAAATLLLLLAAPMIVLGVRAREIAARLALVLVSVAFAFAAASVVLAPTVKPRYVEDPVASLHPAAEVPARGVTRRRQPDLKEKLNRADVPEEAVPTAAGAATGGATPDWITLTTDDDGFRNATSRGRFDVVVVGDSFAEGSMVSDDEVWTRLLARRTGHSVYNAAVSGASPRTYVNNLAVFGLPKRPRLVIATLYEGNDFKVHPDDVPTSGLRARLRHLGRLAFKESPLRARLKGWLYAHLAETPPALEPGPAPVAAPGPAAAPSAPAAGTAPSAAAPRGLAWLPVPIAGHPYDLEPKMLHRLDRTPEAFAASRAWTTNRRSLDDLLRITRGAGADLLVVWAPSKERVALPAVMREVAPGTLRAFAAYDARELPPPDVYEAQLRERLGAMEEVFLGWCRERGVRCVSLTAPLRSRLEAGDQVYFTWDPHWTREGHEVVAETLRPFLESVLASTGDATPP